MINLPPDFFERIVREQQTISGVVQVLSELRLKYASRIQFASVTEALGLKNLGAAIESVLNAICNPASQPEPQGENDDEQREQTHAGTVDL